MKMKKKTHFTGRVVIRPITFRSDWSYKSHFRKNDFLQSSRNFRVIGFIAVSPKIEKKYSFWDIKINILQNLQLLLTASLNFTRGLSPRLMTLVFSCSKLWSEIRFISLLSGIISCDWLNSSSWKTVVGSLRSFLTLNLIMLEIGAAPRDHWYCRRIRSKDVKCAPQS